MATDDLFPGENRVPPVGTMAYAQWKRTQELRTSSRETQETGKPAGQETGRPTGQEPSKVAGPQESRPSGRALGHKGGQLTSSAAGQQVGRAGPETSIASVLTKRLKPLGEGEPIKKGTYLLTRDEDEILEELKLRIRRQFKIEATKNDIVRAAIRSVGQEFARDAERSNLVQKLKAK